MAFVKEEIPKEMIEKYSIEHTYDWCVDRERETVFYYSGGNFRGPEKTFVLIWKGTEIELGSKWYETIVEKNESKVKTETDWRDTYVVIPKHLEAQRQEILQAVVEAFDCHNFLGKKVTFEPKMNFKERI